MHHLEFFVENLHQVQSGVKAGKTLFCRWLEPVVPGEEMPPVSLQDGFDWSTLLGPAQPSNELLLKVEVFFKVASLKVKIKKKFA